MALYETTVILRPELAGADVEKLSDELAGIVTSNNGKLVKKAIWGLKELAYKVKKNKKGNFVHYNFEADSSAMAELRRKLKISEDVIRELTVKVSNFNQDAINLEG